MAKEPKRIESVSEYTRYIEEHLDQDDLLFRGQPGDKPLQPRIARFSLKEEILATERRMFSDFKRQALPFVPSQPVNDWDWLALAQHHGLATRFTRATLSGYLSRAKQRP